MRGHSSDQGITGDMPESSQRPGALRTPAELRDIILAERSGEAFLVWRTGGGERQALLLLTPDQWRVTVGRDPGADVPLTWDPSVSRTHALLERVGGGWTLVDDGLSRNGSFVNGSRVRGRCRLADHDRISVGDCEIFFREPVVGAAESTASIGADVPTVSLSPLQRRVLIALCRPVHTGVSAIPATNREVAEEVFLSIDAVKAHLRVLFERFGLSDLPQNEKRARLAAAVLLSGAIDPREF